MAPSPCSAAMSPSILMSRCRRAVLAVPAGGLPGRGRWSALVLERTLYRRLYRRSHLDQVLFSIGLVFMAMAAADYLHGRRSSRSSSCRTILRGRVEMLGVGIGIYRLFIIVDLRRAGAGAATGAGATPASAAGCAPRSTIRASRAASASMSTLVFAATFAVGSRPRRARRRAGRRDPRRRPDLPAEIHDLFPDRGDGRRHIEHHRPVPGGAAARRRRCRRQVLRARRFGAFVIYAVMIVVLLLRPHGLFARGGSR